MGNPLRYAPGWPGGAPRWTTSAKDGVGIHLADLPVSGRSAGSAVLFTISWPERSAWEGMNYSIGIVKA